VGDVFDGSRLGMRRSLVDRNSSLFRLQRDRILDTDRVTSLRQIRMTPLIPKSVTGDRNDHLDQCKS